MFEGVKYNIRIIKLVVFGGNYYFKNMIYVGLTITTSSEQWANQDTCSCTPILFISTLKSRLNRLRKVFIFCKFFIYKLLTKYVYLVGNFICLYDIFMFLFLAFLWNFLSYLVLF